MNKLFTILRPLFLSSWHPFAWFILVGFLVYGQTLSFGFSYFDDNVLIVDRVGELRNFSQMGTIFKTDVFHLDGKSASYYRPFLILSFMLNAFFSAGNPFGYHLFNIIIHLVAASLVFLLLVRLRFPKLKSFCLSLLFLVHPALVQAVAWLPGRNDSLLTIFILSSFLFFINYLKTSRLRDYSWHLVFLGCALLTKESAIIFPFICVCYVFLLRIEDRGRLSLKVYGGWLACLAAWLFLKMGATQTPSVFLDAWVKFIFVNSPALLLYLGKIFFPLNLCVLPILRDSHLWFGIAAFVLIATLILFAQHKNYKVMAFGGLWFLSFLFFSLVRSTSLLIPADFLEHRLYLPIIGLIIILAQLKPFPYLQKRNVAAALLFTIYFCIFVAINIVYTQNFKNRLSFWQNAIKHSPHSPLAHANMGAMYYLEGKKEAASYEYQQALSLNPRQEMVHNNLGLILMHEGKGLRAEEEFLVEIAINPRYADVYYNFGLLRYRQGRQEEAYQLMKKTLEISPSHAGAQEFLAGIGDSDSKGQE
jgi:tetratricopeptide (TPR) repeat protein